MMLSLHLSAGQCTGSSCTSNNGDASLWETRINCSRHCGRPTSRTSNRLTTAFAEWCRNDSSTRQYRTWNIYSRGWWARGLASNWV